MLKNKIILKDSKDFQTTINRKVDVNGKSPYASGVFPMSLIPADVNHGIVFEVKDVGIPANYRYVKYNESHHTTTLVRGGTEIKTVEHLLSAIWGAGIDNISIKLSSPFIPMRESNASEFLDLIQKAGVRVLTLKRRYLQFKSKVIFKEKNDDRYAIFRPYERLRIKSTTSFDNLIGTRTINFAYSKNNYVKKISWARSFLRVPLDKRGIVWRDVRRLFKFLPKNPKESPIIVFSDKEFYTPLVSRDEPARHKVLDFIGDMALLGIRLKADITLFKPGHKFTRSIVKQIAEALHP